MSNSKKQLDESLIGKKIPYNQIPLIDFSPFLEGDIDRKRDVALQIGKACRNIGFFYISNHGIPLGTVDKTVSEIKRFFALPLEEKLKISIEKSSCHRGYYKMGGENLDPKNQKSDGDLKEGIKIGRDLSLNHPLVKAETPLHGPNQWPKNLPGWREQMETYYSSMLGLGLNLMKAFALSLNVEENFFDKWLTGPMATSGPIHYPNQKGTISEKRLGAGAHTDFGCLTMLWQDEVGGLQVKNVNEEWIDAPCISNTFVVNIGDMMARWTNGIFSSTTHRVINTSGKDRYSIPFFFDPDFNADVTCLETCHGPDNPPRFAPTTGGQHLLDMINATFEYHRENKATA